MKWRMLDLFSGIGGFSLAAQWVWGDDLEIVAFCEIDKFCQKVLHKHWPNVPIVEDVRNVMLIANDECLGWTKRTREEIQPQEQETIRSILRDICTERIDLLTGGFPCQPFSVAGKRRGKEDNRFLWPECIRVVREIKPRWVIFENVPGIKRMVLDDCLSDLEAEGYWNYIDKKGKKRIAPLMVPACAVNAPHRRDRVWIVAHNEQSGLEGTKTKANGWGKCKSFNGSSLWNRFGPSSQDVAESSTSGFQDGNARENRFRTYPQSDEKGCRYDPETWSTEPDVGRVTHGVPSRVDRLKSLGNAIVPQVAYQIFIVIKELNEIHC